MPRAADIADLTDDTPVPLKDAVALFFPFGGVTERSLRTEIEKGRLAVERIAGKDFVTRKSIDQMRELCRVQKSQRDCVSGETMTGKKGGLSKTDQSISAQDALRARLNKPNKHSTPTVPASTSQTPANVIPIISGSQTC